MQFVHVPASTPQADLAVPPRHAPAAVQQPAQVRLSQTQALATQWRPAPQGLPLPQPHAPLARQVSALSRSHAMHVWPAGAQASALRVWQTPLEQQPEGQLVTEQGDAPQAPPSQLPEPQPTQAPPPEPQAVEAVPGKQLPLEQQPLGQLLGSHTVVMQPPSAQLPVGQRLHAPPPAPHALAEVPGWQVPVLSQQPVGQVLALHAAAAHDF